MNCPLHHTDHITKLASISCLELIQRYEQELQIDVSHYFANLRHITLYRCDTTGYRFYYPFSVPGLSEFYEKLEEFDWYYMPWKWEHTIAEKIIKKGDKVLEVGAAKGSFIQQLQKKSINAEGLELNKSAIESAKRRQLKVYAKTVEDFSRTHQNKYTVVCSFQVLEHIAEVDSFISASLSCLKKGGLLIISVPNNYPHSLVQENSLLNLPPHHMGLWDMNSLIQLQHSYPMTLEQIHLEPLQKYHLGYARNAALKYVSKKISQKFGSLAQLTTKHFTSPLLYLGSEALADHLLGHSIMVVYRKV